jgi:acyl-CoA synthetase (AMP-forming)/AMP-acid ligase II
MFFGALRQSSRRAVLQANARTHARSRVPSDCTNEEKVEVIADAENKVYSVEVENVLTHHVAIIEAAVVGRPDPDLGERVHAFIVPKSQVASSEEIHAFCAERLSDYKVPDPCRATPSGRC